MAIYTVKTPDGGTIKVNGPDNASDEDVIKYAQKLYEMGDAAPVYKAPQPAESAPIPRGVGDGEFSVMDMMRNVPGSAKNFAGGIIEAVASPVDTAKNIGKMAMGLGAMGSNKALGTEFGPDVTDPGQALIDFYRERYGDTDKALQALESDPVGVAADLATVLSGGVAALRAARLPGAARVATEAASVIDPTSNLIRAGLLGVKGTANLAGKLPEKMFQHGAEFKNMALIEDFLSEGIHPSRDLDALKAKRQKVGEDIGKMVDDYRPLIHPRELFSGARANRDAKLTAPGIEGVRQKRAYGNELSNAAMEFGAMPVTGTNRLSFWTMPMSTAGQIQKFKSDIGKRLYEKKTPERYAMGAQQGKETAREFLRSRAAEMLASRIGKYSNANKSYGRYSDMLKEAARVAPRISQRNGGALSSYWAPATGGSIGAWLGGPLGSVAGILGGLGVNKLRSPETKIANAIRLKKIQNLDPTKSSRAAPALGDLLSYIGEIGTDEDKRLIQEILNDLL